MIKLITFDLDNTLWDVDPVIIRAAKLLKDWMQDTHPDVVEVYNMSTYSLVKRKIAEETPDKMHLPTFFRKQLLLYCYSQIGLTDKLLEQQVEEAFNVFDTARNQIDFYPETIPLLKRLADRFALIALSNGNADIQRVGLGTYFTAQFSADSTGKPKPDPTMFRLALKHADAKAEETIHIGDHQHEDIDAAKGIGIRTIWFNQNGRQTTKTCSPDREVHSLREVFDAVQEIEGAH